MAGVSQMIPPPTHTTQLFSPRVELPPAAIQGAPSMAIPMATVMGTLWEKDNRGIRRENN